MKRISIAIAAVILAVGAFAFTNKHDKPLTSYYWFQTQNDGTVIDATSVPPFQATDPLGCTSGTKGCSKAFTSYQQMAPNDYAPAGTLTVTHKKP